ncbi:MAG: hypothetical protein ACLFQ5_10790 [Oceanicaulis sp.]
MSQNINRPEQDSYGSNPVDRSGDLALLSMLYERDVEYSNETDFLNEINRVFNDPINNPDWYNPFAAALLTDRYIFRNSYQVSGASIVVVEDTYSNEINVLVDGVEFLGDESWATPGNQGHTPISVSRTAMAWARACGAAAPFLRRS